MGHDFKRKSDQSVFGYLAGGTQRGQPLSARTTPSCIEIQGLLPIAWPTDRTTRPGPSCVPLGWYRRAKAPSQDQGTFVTDRAGLRIDDGTGHARSLSHRVRSRGASHRRGSLRGLRPRRTRSRDVASKLPRTCVWLSQGRPGATSAPRVASRRRASTGLTGAAGRGSASPQMASDLPRCGRPPAPARHSARLSRRPPTPQQGPTLPSRPSHRRGDHRSDAYCGRGPRWRAAARADRRAVASRVADRRSARARRDRPGRSPRGCACSPLLAQGAGPRRGDAGAASTSRSLAQASPRAGLRPGGCRPRRRIGKRHRVWPGAGPHRPLGRHDGRLTPEAPTAVPWPLYSASGSASVKVGRQPGPAGSTSASRRSGSPGARCLSSVHLGEAHTRMAGSKGVAGRDL